MSAVRGGDWVCSCWERASESGALASTGVLVRDAGVLVDGDEHGIVAPDEHALAVSKPNHNLDAAGESLTAEGVSYRLAAGDGTDD